MMCFSDLLVILTLTQKNKERGSRAKQRRREAKASRIAQQPGPSGSPGSSRCTTQSVLSAELSDRPSVRILRIFFMQVTLLFSSF